MPFKEEKLGAQRGEAAWVRHQNTDQHPSPPYAQIKLYTHINKPRHLTAHILPNVIKLCIIGGGEGKETN